MADLETGASGQPKYAAFGARGGKSTAAKRAARVARTAPASAARAPALPARRTTRATSPGAGAAARALPARPTARAASAGAGAAARALDATAAEPAPRTRGQRLAGSVYALYLLTLWERASSLPPAPALPLPPAHLFADSRYWGAPDAAPAPAPGDEPSDDSGSEASAGGRAGRHARRAVLCRVLLKRAKLEAARQLLLQEHILPRRTLCQGGPGGRGCGALVWEGEKDMCCRKGQCILTEELNPPNERRVPRHAAAALRSTFPKG